MDLVNFMRTQSLSIGRIDQPGGDPDKKMDKKKNNFARRSLSSNQMTSSPISSPMMSIAEEHGSPRSDMSYGDELIRMSKSRSRSMVENKFENGPIFRQEPILATNQLTPSFSAPEALNDYDREPHMGERRLSFNKGKSPRARSPMTSGKPTRPGRTRRFSMTTTTPGNLQGIQATIVQKRRASFPDILDGPPNTNSNHSLSSLPTFESLSSNASSPSCTSPHSYNPPIGNLRVSHSSYELSRNHGYNDYPDLNSLRLEVINEVINEHSDDMYEDHLEIDPSFQFQEFNSNVNIMPEPVHAPTLIPDNTPQPPYSALKYDFDFEDFQDMSNV